MSPNAHDVGVALRLAVSLLALVFAWQRIVLPTLTETLRQNIFETRRAMFRYMADGYVSPDEPAYAYLRATMNSGLRIAERFTFSRLLFCIAFFATKREPAHSDLLLARVEDETVRTHLAQFRDRYSLSIVTHAVLTSPLGLLLAVIALPHALYETFVRGRLKDRRDADSFLLRIPTRNAVIEVETQACLTEGPDFGGFPSPPISHSGTHVTL